MSAYLKSSAVKAAILIVGLGFGATGVMAEPLAPRSVQPAQGIGENLNLVQYYKKKKRVDRDRRHNSKRWGYDNRRHGKRFRGKRSGYGYYRDGWWYSRPYWNSDPGVTIRLGL